MAAMQILLFLLTVLVSQSLSAIIVQTNNGTQIELSSMEIIYQGSQSEKIQFPMIFEVTTDRNAELMTGKMFVISSSLAIDEIIIEVQNKGALAILYLSQQYRVPGYLKYRFSNKQLISQIRIPIFELGVPQGSTYQSLTGITNVTILPSDEPNSYELVYTSSLYYLFNVFLGAFPAVNLSLAIWKTKLFCDYYGGLQSSIVFYILFLEMLSNSIRIVSAVDPLCGNFIFPEQVSVAFMELAFPFALSSVLLFVFYWHEMMTISSIIVHTFITKLKIPFFALSGFLFCVQMMRIFLRNFTTIPKQQFITAIVYTAVILGISIFYIITGVKLLKGMNESKNLGRKNVKLRRATVKMIIGASFMMSFVIFTILFASGTVYYAAGFLITWGFLWTIIHAISLMNILAFEIPSGTASPNGRSRAPTAFGNPPINAATEPAARV